MIFIVEFIVAFFATTFFAILFSVPKKELIFCGFTGGFGWIIYYILSHNGIGPVLSSGIATFFLTIFARLFAVLRKNPVTIYLLTGIFPLVPGARIFYSAYYLFIEETLTASQKGITTFEIAGAIVFGIIFGFAIPQYVFSKIGKLIKN